MKLVEASETLTLKVLINYSKLSLKCEKLSSKARNVWEFIEAQNTSKVTVKKQKRNL
jgi:hypothetical protein